MSVQEEKEGEDENGRAYLGEFDALFQKHLNWNDHQVIDIFKAENGSLKEDDVVRLFNKWVHKRRTPCD